MRPFEITRSGLLGTLVVFVVAATCVRLGFWQLDRRSQRQARNATVAARLDEPVLPVTMAPTDTAGLTYRRVSLSGQYDNDRTVVLAGRSRNGVPGVNVLTPLRLSIGAILVNRGWVPSRDAATITLDSVRHRGLVRLVGVVLPFPEVDAPEIRGFRTTWFRLDGDAIRAQYPYRLAPVYVQRERDIDSAAASDANPAPGIVPRPLDPPDLTAGPHLSYALQWFSFAAIFVVGWAALVIRRTRPPDSSGGPRQGPGPP